MVVVMEGRTISRIEAYRPERAPSNAIIVSGEGKFLIPGLWDMHVHLYDAEYFPLLLANGVTGVRQMWGQPIHHSWKPLIASGALIGPQQSIASPIIDGVPPVWTGSVRAGSADDARAAVRVAKKAGSDFIKVYNRLTRDAYFAIVDEAKAQGLPIAGHVPVSVSLLEASAAGQRSIEHLSGVLLAASKREAEFRAPLADAVTQRKPEDELRAIGSRNAPAVLASFDDRKAATLYDALAKNGTVQIPTLVVNRAMAFLDDVRITNDPRLKYVTVRQRQQWDPANDFRVRNRTADDWAHIKLEYRKLVSIVGEMHRRGVEILAGTDFQNPYCFPGFSLHDELALLVEAGLSPADALRSATSTAARFLKILGSTGTLDVGKTADAVLLDGNPLADIKNTSRIAGVVQRGQYFRRDALDQMLRGVEAFASKRPIALVLAKTIDEQGITAAVKEYERVRREDPNGYLFAESELNRLGYQLLGQKRIADAIEVFKLNVNAYPKSGNVYDSLGEAYMIAGVREPAIENYERSLSLDPANTNAVEMLRKLRSQ